MNYKILLCIIAGIILWAYYNQWIIIRPFFWRNTSCEQNVLLTKQKVTLFYGSQEALQSESCHLIWNPQNHPQAHAYNATALATAYFSLLDDELMISKKITVQTAMIAGHGHLILSLSDNPFDQQSSAASKWSIIYGLLHTIHKQLPAITMISFLVHHQPLYDPHLDFSRPLPVQGWLPDIITSTNHYSAFSTEKYTIMLDPLGDAQHTGRVIDQTFERSITVQCAQAIKDLIESNYKDIRVVLTRFPGEIIEPLQNAAFANRIQTHLYISIGFYQITSEPTEIMLFVLSYDPLAESFSKMSTDLSFEPFYTAHKKLQRMSMHAAATIAKGLRETKPYAGVVKQCTTIPYKPLTGITKPACALEIGLRYKDDWKNLVGALATQIVKAAQISY